MTAPPPPKDPCRRPDADPAAPRAASAAEAAVVVVSTLGVALALGVSSGVLRRRQ